jgi:hypothetical protein
MTTVTDDFAGTGAVSGSWGGGYTASYVRNSDVLQVTSGTGALMWTANTFSGDQEAQIKVAGTFSGGVYGYGPVLKGVNDGSGAEYLVSYRTDTIFIKKNGSTQAENNTTTTIAVGDTIRATAVASGGNCVITAYVNGVQKIQWTDSSPLTGIYIGLQSHSGASGSDRYDDFSGGDYVAGGGSATYGLPVIFRTF